MIESGTRRELHLEGPWLTGRSTGSRVGRSALLLVAVAASYYLGARLGFVLRFPPATTSVIWPPNAFLTAVLLLTPPRRWWTCILAVLPAHILVEAQAGFSAGLIAALFVTNCLEAILAAGAVWRWSDDPGRFDTLHRVTVFVLGAVLMAPLVTTFADAAAVHWWQGEPYDLVWLRRIFSNTLSQLTLVPSLVLLISRGPTWLRRSSTRDRFEAALMALGIASVGGVVFTGYEPGSPFLPGGPYTSLPFLLPLLIVAAVRFGPAGASLSLLATALLAIGTAIYGWTPLTMLPAEGRVVALQVFLLVVGVPLLVLSGLIEERRQGAATLRERLRFEELLSQLSGAFVHHPSHQMGQAFETWLERVGHFLGLDWVVLRQFSEGHRELKVVAGWHAAGRGPSPPVLEASEFSWTARRFMSRESVAWSDLQDVPKEAVAEKELLQRIGIRSLLGIPLVAGEQVLGSLGLASTSARRSWPEDLIQRCRLLADVFASALARKRVEDALRASETIKSAVLESLTSHVAVLDRDGFIIAVNESWKRFARDSGLPTEESIGVGVNYLEVCRSAANGGDPEARAVCAGIVGVIEGSRPSFSHEYQEPPPHSGRRWFHMMVVPLLRPEGGAVISHTDVTERRHAEMEAKRSQQELAHYLRVSTVGALTTSLAHELNQPLTAILANAQTARRLLSAPAANELELREILGEIIEEDKRAGEVIQRLRELLRKGEPERVPLDANVLVRDVCRLLDSDALIRGVTLRVDLAPGPLVTLGDRVQLQQVVLNLIVNAIEALAHFEGDRTVRVRTAEAPGGLVRVSIEDTGPGLRPSDRGRIFQPFYSTKTKGMGMGLSIARSILEAHGGTIVAEDNPVAGATFTFNLPPAPTSRPGL
jgi:two-component system sensor kinase FixL